MGLQSATLACAPALSAYLPSTPVLLLRERHASCNSRHVAARVPALTTMRERLASAYLLQVPERLQVPCSSHCPFAPRCRGS